MAVWFAVLLFGGSDVFFEGSLDEVFAQAKKQEKLIVVDVYTTWCGPCKLLDKTTWSDARVKKLLGEDVIGVKIDAEKGEGIDFARKYKISAYPNLLILNAEGEVVSRQVGYVAPAQFLEWVRQVI